MNRMDEAFRRARRDLELPESFGTPDSAALDYFQTGDADGLSDAIDTLRTGADVPQPVAPAPATLEPPAATPAYRIGGPHANGGARSNGAAHNGNMGTRMVTNNAVSTVTVEQYRRLAATLHHAQTGTGIKVVMVASALAGEGKTLTAVNLALTLSESYGRRVLLIDADLRRPTLHDVFHVPNGSGLNDAPTAEPERPLSVLELSPRLSLLPAGKPDPDPMSVLTSSRMRRIIDEAAARYDWVLLDTPPVALLTDAHLLAAMVNAVVLVIQASRTPVAVIQRAIESLDRERVIGVVLNLVDDKAITPGGKYEQYYASSYNRADNRGRSVLSPPTADR